MGSLVLVVVLFVSLFVFFIFKYPNSFKAAEISAPIMTTTPSTSATESTCPVCPSGTNVEKDSNGKPVTEQDLALGPVASQIAIKQLGTNGGGYYNANSAHPYENPTPLSNFLEMMAILLISGGLCYTFGYMVKDRRQGWALLAAMLIIFLPCLWFVGQIEQNGNPLIKTNFTIKYTILVHLHSSIK